MALSHAIPDIDVTARIDRAEVNVGDRVRYEITVVHPADGTVELPALRGNTGNFDVLGHEARTDSASGNRASVTHVLTLAAFVPGDDSLPPQRVEFRRRGDDTAAAVLYTPPTAVRVARVSVDGDTLEDITGVERLPRGVPWGLLLLLSAAGIALLAWRLRKKTPPRPRPEASAPPVPVVPPDEEALEALRTLEQAGWREQPRAFAFGLSEILRRYLGRRYGIDALEATTGELLERARALPLPGGTAGGDINGHEWLRACCTELDTVKFAAGTVADDDAGRWLRGARAFVEVTRPAPDPAAPPESARANAGERAT